MFYNFLIDSLCGLTDTPSDVAKNIDLQNVSQSKIIKLSSVCNGTIMTYGNAVYCCIQDNQQFGYFPLDVQSTKNVLRNDDDEGNISHNLESHFEELKKKFTLKVFEWIKFKFKISELRVQFNQLQCLQRKKRFKFRLMNDGNKLKFKYEIVKKGRFRWKFKMFFCRLRNKFYGRRLMSNGKASNSHLNITRMHFLESGKQEENTFKSGGETPFI
jgi:hypothetical protein